jgi:hypothetical protein
MADFHFLLNPPPARLAQSSAVLHGFTKGYGPDYRVSGFRTPLSLKAVARGAAFYRTPQGHYRVTEDCFLILNRGQEYALEIDGLARTALLLARVG